MHLLISLYLSFLKIGLFSIGGGYVMLPLIQKEIIENRGWLTLSEFIDILAISEMTPGPVAINSATFIGYRTAGFWGSVCATAGVVTPSFVFVIIAVAVLKHFYENRWVQAAFIGLRPAVVALIMGTVIFVGKEGFTDLTSVIIGISAFALLVFTRIHPILVIVLTALAGMAIYS